MVFVRSDLSLKAKPVKVNTFFEILLGKKTMSEIPPFPNSVNAVQPVSKNQVQKIDIDRMLSRETNDKQQIVTTIYDARVYTYRGGQLSQT